MYCSSNASCVRFFLADATISYTGNCAIYIESHALLIYLWYDGEKETVQVSAGSSFDECFEGIFHREYFGYCDLVRRDYSRIIFMTHFFYAGYVNLFALLSGCRAKGKINEL